MPPVSISQLATNGFAAMISERERKSVVGSLATVPRYGLCISKQHISGFLKMKANGDNAPRVLKRSRFTVVAD